MKEKVEKTACQRDGHAYLVIEGSDARETVGNDTHVNRSFYCTKCADVVAKTIVVWKNFIPGKKEQK